MEISEKILIGVVSGITGAFFGLLGGAIIENNLGKPKTAYVKEINEDCNDYRKYSVIERRDGRQTLMKEIIPGSDIYVNFDDWTAEIEKKEAKADSIIAAEREERRIQRKDLKKKLLELF